MDNQDSFFQNQKLDSILNKHLDKAKQGRNYNSGGEKRFERKNANASSSQEYGKGV